MVSGMREQSQKLEIIVLQMSINQKTTIILMLFSKFGSPISFQDNSIIHNRFLVFGFSSFALKYLKEENNIDRKTV